MTQKTKNLFDADGKWVALIDGVRMLIRLGDDGSKLAIFITHQGWENYDHPSSLKAKHGPEAVGLFRQAQVAFQETCSRLEIILKQGKIEGEGLHEDTGRRAPITKSEWATLHIDFWKNRLRHPRSSTRKEWITDVMIRADDIVKRCTGPAQTNRRRGRMPKFDWDAIGAKAFSLMDYHGDFSKDDKKWNAQVRLENALMGFCKEQFGEEPSVSSLRERLPAWLMKWRGSKL